MTEADDIVALMATILAAETGRAVVLATAEADGDSIAVAVAEAEASRLHVLHVVLALLGGAGRRPPPCACPECADVLGRIAAAVAEARHHAARATDVLH